MRKRLTVAAVGLVVVGALACTHSPAATQTSPSAGSGSATLARVYYWRAKPGKFAEYTDYISKLAEPIVTHASSTMAIFACT